MKSAAISLCCAVWVIASGCEGLPKTWEAKKTAMPAPASAAPQPAKPGVTPDQVSEQNAHQVASDLLDEMERDTQNRPSADAGRSEPRPGSK
jgi:hypothetical protein